MVGVAAEIHYFMQFQPANRPIEEAYSYLLNVLCNKRSISLNEDF